MKVVATAAAIMVLQAASGLQAKDKRSLTDFEYAQLGQEISVPAANDAGPVSLEERLVLARASIRALTEALGIANSEAEVFKRQVADLHLKVDAYGLSGFEKEPGKIEQRLLGAVRDLRLVKKQNEEANNQLVRLAESIQLLIKTSNEINPKARVTVETELRKTAEILGASNAEKTETVEATLTDGTIVDIKEELSLAVANIGRKQGVKIGMPFQIWRENQQIGTARVVDVRDRVCGAVIQNLESEKKPAKTGDRLRVDAKK